MSAADLAAVIVTGLCVIVVVVLVLATQALIATLRQLREAIDELRGESLPMFNDLRTTVNKAGDELKRVDEVIGKVERVVATADFTSRLTQKIVTPALIRTVAIMKGATRATLILRRGRVRKSLPAHTPRQPRKLKAK